jgi:hypothetical protein
MADFNDELFDSLDGKMDFLNDEKKVNNDGIYRIDMSKVKDKKKGYRSVLRFLPNVTKEGKLGQMAIEKISHYVDIKEPRELSGYFDSPRNFGDKCPLTDLYFNLTNSKNAILQTKAEMLKYSKKYYSYVLVLEDEQQPELVGKIMILQYGKIIRDKILSEKNGEISGVPCNVFDWTKGKDFVMIVKEIQTGNETYPDYKTCTFKPDTSTLPMYFKEKAVFKNIPVGTDGAISKELKGKVVDFLLDREFELEDFGPKPLTEEQHAKITDISNFLTGKSSSGFTSGGSKPKSEDFDLDESFDEEPKAESVTAGEDFDDDFFND